MSATGRASRPAWVLLVLSCATAAVCAAPDVAQIEQGVVRIFARVEGGIGTGTGFIINDTGLVATNHHVVDGGMEFRLHVSGSTAHVEAQVVWANAELDLAMLHAPGLGGEPLVLSTAPLEAGDEVWALGFPGLADRLGDAVESSVTSGVIGRLFSGEWGERAVELEIIQHSAQINPGNSGGPLFDACGAVIGVNTQGSGAGRIVRDAGGAVVDIMAGTGIYFASRITELIEALQAENRQFTASDTGCEQKAEVLEGLRRALVDTRGQLAEVVRSYTEELRIRDLKFWTVSGIMALGVLVALAFALRKPRERIREIVGQAGERLSRVYVAQRSRRQLKRGIVVSGYTPDGQPLRLHLRGSRFADQEYGLTIGRSPGIVDAVIADAHISRRHLRIRWNGKGFEMEDLNSSNGTVVNGERLEPFRGHTIAAGDVVRIGGLDLLVSMG